MIDDFPIDHKKSDLSVVVKVYANNMRQAQPV
jgi:hypothetical protein